MSPLPCLRPNQRLLIVTAAAGALVISACGRAPSATTATAPTPVPAAPVTAQQAKRGDIQQTLAYSGDIRSREQVSVLPKSAGRIERMLVDVGSRVKAGDTLATLEQESAQIAALQARATLAGAEAKLATLQIGAKPGALAAPAPPLI